MKEVNVEMKKVVWPNKKEVSGATWVVIITVVTVALFIGIVDLALMKLVSLILK